jgi:hypothetical protein
MASSTTLSLMFLTQIAIVTLFLYIIALAIYRLRFSPIAKFPGPKLAALTLWYEFYHDVIRGGQYVFRINELHEQYGMTVSSFYIRLCTD